MIMAAWPVEAQAPAADVQAIAQQWQSLTAQAMEAYRAGDPARAAATSEKALQLVRQTLGNRAAPTLTNLNFLAGFYTAQGRYREAEPLYREALQGRREVLGPRHPDTLASIHNLAECYFRQGRYGDAEPLYREAQQARRDVLGPRHPDTLNTMNSLGRLYFSQGRYRDAEPLYQEALQVQREVLGPRDEKTLTSLHNLAQLYAFQGRHGEAESLYQETLQASREVLGPRHLVTLGSLISLAQLYQMQGRYREAEALLREALQASREALGPRHENTLASLNSLAEALRLQGRYGEAEPLYREALQTMREAFGPRHPQTLAGLSNLALLYDQQGRYAEAEPLYREVLQGERETLGLRHPGTLTSLNNLALHFDRVGRYGEAEPIYLEVLQAARETLGPRHPNTLMGLHNLALLYRHQGRYDKAEPLYRETLQLSGEVLGRGHPVTLGILHDLAVLYDVQDRYGEAEPLLQEALQGRREALGPRHPETLATQISLAGILVEQGRRAEAVRTLQQMEPNALGWIGQEFHNTEASAVRRHLGLTQASFQDAVLTLATAPGSSGEARQLAGSVMLRFKVLQGEEEAYLARLARRSQDPHVHALVKDIGGLRATLAAAAEKTSDAFEKMLQALEGKRRELIDISPEYKDRLQALNASVDDVRQVLPAGAVLIEIRQFRPIDFHAGKVGDPRFAALLLTSSGEPVVADLGPVSEVQSLATAVDGPASARGMAPPISTLDDQAAAKLYERLFAPFKGALASATTVYVAPDGILNLIPFARLKLPDGRYWFEQQEVHLVQTGRDLLRPAADRPVRGLLALGGIDFGAAPAGAGAQPEDSVFFAAVGSDRSGAVTRAASIFGAGFPALPATADEVRLVAKWYRSQHAGEPAETWSGADASKARLMALKTPPRVLHLATHGFYLPSQSREPMLLSGIALAGANLEVGGNGKEGILFALEAEGLNLDGTELVVLSACDTAKGAVDYSEGVFGLARALRTAGARSVLVTLWPLDDGEARDFMADFYRNWSGPVQNGTRSDPAKALRDTQRQWIRQNDRGNPRAWAPYVLIE
jgi:CHAT domain-containing protein